MTTMSGPETRGHVPSHWRSATRRDQAYAVAVGVVLLGCAMFFQGFVWERDITSKVNGEVVKVGVERRGWPMWSLEGRRREPFDRSGNQLVREDPESEKTLGSLAVTFPRLTLGGLRGVASTYLWIQAEEDKNERRWVDLETKYDLIGALQPYFASVYVYHSWNQAYNLSAQWQEQDIKYKWVLDGLSYVYKGEDFNPSNPDIMFEEAQLLAQKLGLSFERTYYRAHWRSDISRLHELNVTTKAKTDDTVSLQHVRSFVTRTDPRDPPGSDTSSTDRDPRRRTRRWTRGPVRTRPSSPPRPGSACSRRSRRAGSCPRAPYP